MSDAAGQAVVDDAGAGRVALAAAQRVDPEAHAPERTDRAGGEPSASGRRRHVPRNGEASAGHAGRHAANHAHRCIDSIYCNDVIEMAVLGLLQDQDLHGYELRKRLTSLVGLRGAISFGSLYPGPRPASKPAAR